MSPRRVAIIGVGKRVREAVLPAFRALEDLFEVRSLHARSSREIEAAGRAWPVAPLSALSTLDDVDLIYLAVGKDAVPSVLGELASFERSATDILIDTPVVRFKHFRHMDKLQGYSHAWVPEDCAYLPWLPPLWRAADSGALGNVENATLFRSGYAYHGLATIKAMLKATGIRRGRRRRRPDGLLERRLGLTVSASGQIVEPRDYSKGYISLEGSSATATDRAEHSATSLPMLPVFAAGALTAIRVGDELENLDDAERSLTLGLPTDATLTAGQEAMKRIGLLRLLRDVHAGRGGYPLAAAVDDMVIDYHLEKLGRYIATPITDPRSPLARAALRAISRFGG
ncbi:MAG: hypothetical protein QF599_10025 [Planctomycetota bacterium]|nr:hypothetical protein [Planctomycetota bacterium]